MPRFAVLMCLSYWRRMHIISYCYKAYVWTRNRNHSTKGIMSSFIKNRYMYVHAQLSKIPVNPNVRSKLLEEELKTILSSSYRFCENELGALEDLQILMGLKISSSPKQVLSKILFTKGSRNWCYLTVAHLLLNYRSWGGVSNPQARISLHTSSLSMRCFLKITSIQCVNNLDQIFKICCIIHWLIYFKGKETNPFWDPISSYREAGIWLIHEEGFLLRHHNWFLIL